MSKEYNQDKTTAYLYSSLTQNASGTREIKDESRSSDGTEIFQDVQILSENVSTSPAEGLTCHVVDHVTKLEELERDHNRSLQVLNKQLEEIEKNQEETIKLLQQSITQTKEGVLLLSEMPGKIKSDGMDDPLEITTKEQKKKMELLTQQIAQIEESENLIARVGSSRDETQVNVDECKKELAKQQKEMNDQFDGEGAARQVKSPFKEDKDGIM